MPGQAPTTAGALDPDEGTVVPARRGSPAAHVAPINENAAATASAGPKPSPNALAEA
jgi:hypothetical protein